MKNETGRYGVEISGSDNTIIPEPKSKKKHSKGLVAGVLLAGATIFTAGGFVAGDLLGTYNRQSNAPTYKSPMASLFSAFPASGNNLEVLAAMDCTSDRRGGIAVGIWDFGDGSTPKSSTFVDVVVPPDIFNDSSIKNLVSTKYGYTEPGIYTVTGKCVDTLGYISPPVSMSVTITKKPIMPSPTSPPHKNHNTV